MFANGSPPVESVTCLVKFKVELGMRAPLIFIPLVLLGQNTALRQL